MEGRYLFDWIFGNYARDALISLRRELDDQPKALTFVNLLYQIEAQPRTLCRGRYRRQFLSKGPLPADDQDRPDQCFDRFSLIRIEGDPERDYIDPASVERDRKALQKNTKAVLGYTQVTIAHRQVLTKPPPSPTFGALHDAIDELEPCLQKYLGMLTAASLAQAEPTQIYDPLKVFAFPWIDQGGGK